jgi:hypothetical protein
MWLEQTVRAAGSLNLPPGRFAPMLLVMFLAGTSKKP